MAVIGRVRDRRQLHIERKQRSEIKRVRLLESVISNGRLGSPQKPINEVVIRYGAEFRVIQAKELG